MDLAEILARSKQVMDVTAGQTKNNIPQTFDEGQEIEYITDVNDIPQDMLESLGQKSHILDAVTPEDIQANAANSKLPKDILESMQKNPIDVSAFDPNRSILDSGDPRIGNLINKVNKNNMRPSQATKTSVQENKGQNTTAQAAPIDYSMIRMIVEETVKKYVNALNKNIIKEVKGSTDNNAPQLKCFIMNDKFQILDESGDLYEAKLEFKKNVKSKK